MPKTSRPILKTSEFRVRKDLLIEKTPAPEDAGVGGCLELPQIHLKRVQNSSFFYIKKRKNRGGVREGGTDKRCVMSTDI